MELFKKHMGNVGACVAGTPFVVLDFDGAEGLATLAELKPPVTLQARSGSGGAHLVYKLAPGQEGKAITDRRALPGMDVKKHGQFLVAPSTHASGGTYEWVELGPIAELPDDLYQKIRKPVAGPDRATRARAYIAKMPPAVSGEGGHTACFAVARKLIQDFQLNEADAMQLLREYNNRCSPPWSEVELQHKYDSALKARVSNPVSDNSPPVAAAETDWRANLLWTSSKNDRPKLKSNLANIVRILQQDPQWRAVIQYDEFNGRTTVQNPPWSKHGLSAQHDPQWSDEDASKLCAWMEHEFHAEGFAPSVNDCERAVAIVARERRIHPVKQYLKSMQWDGQPRIEQIQDALGAPDTEYTHKVIRWWLISAVARVFRPGCKADCVLILEGKTGIGKSKALGILAGEWWSDTTIDLRSKDAYQQIKGKWIIELAELDALMRVSDATAKTFFTSGCDSYRPAYGRNVIEQPRQCVFAGTTNEDAYFKDTTGNRRYWPILCTSIDHAWLFSNRDQIWAEAMHLYEAGELWYPSTPEEKAHTEEAQAQRLERDAWENLVQEWLTLTGHSQVKMGTLLANCLKLEARDWSRSNESRVGKIMKLLGWKRTRIVEGLSRPYVYVRAA